MIAMLILVIVLVMIVVGLNVRGVMLASDLARAKIDAIRAASLERSLNRTEELYWYECTSSYNWQSRAIGANRNKKSWEKKARRRKLIIEQLDRERHKILNQLNFMTNSYETLVDAIHTRSVIKTEGDILGELSLAVQLLDAVRSGEAKLSVPVGDIKLLMERAGT